jgi:hypothetical protein
MSLMHHTSWFAVIAMLCASPAPATASPGRVMFDPVVTASYDPADWLTPVDRFELRTSRAIAPSEGRLGVMIDDTDWTGMFSVLPAGLAYAPGPVALPLGEHDLRVYLVSPANHWQELARIPLRVRAVRRFDTARARPTLEVGNKGQLVQRQFPADTRDPRNTFQDFSLNLGFETALARNGWTTTTRSNFVGVSNQAEALRFGLRGADAPQFDLAQYLVGAANGRAQASLGHVRLDGGRHLVSGFATRGATGSVRLLPALELSLAATNGSSIVGFSNFFGLDRRDHQVVTATLGIDFVRERPGAVRLATTLLDGSLLPLAGFNQGLVNDAEKSRGLSLSFTAADAAHRVQVDAGASRSEFDNPRDPLLVQRFDVVPVQRTTRDARYGEFRLGLLQNVALSPGQVGNLAVAIRHERVDPLYRSIAAAGLRPDILQNVIEIDGSAGPLLSRFSYGRSHDNLPGLASVLTTRTRMTNWTATLPLGALAGRAAGSAWWPRLDYALDRTHQFGDSLPINADFDSLSQVPDQASLNQRTGVSWQGSMWRVGYAYNRSFQDNRQPGRELADFLNFTHNASAGVSAAAADLSVDFSWDGAENRELIQADRTRRAGVGGTWRPARQSTLTGMATTTFSRDDDRTREGRNTDLHVQFAQALSLRAASPEALRGQVFVRFARQTLYSVNSLFGAGSERRIWTINTGLTFRVF